MAAKKLNPPKAGSQSSFISMWTIPQDFSSIPFRLLLLSVCWSKDFYFCTWNY